MLTLDTFEKKKIVDGKMDLLSTYDKIHFDKINILDWIIIDKSSIYLLDVISMVCYGSQNHIDKIIKFNRISNGLDLRVGQILAIPEINSYIENSETIDLDKAKNKNITSQKNQSKLDTIMKNKVVNVGFNGNANNYIKNNPSIKTTPSTNYLKKNNGVYVF